MIFHENGLPADHSHEISCLICFLKKQQNLKLSSAANAGGALWVKTCNYEGCQIKYLTDGTSSECTKGEEFLSHA